MKNNPLYVRLLWSVLRLLLYGTAVVTQFWGLLSLGQNGHQVAMWLGFGAVICGTLCSFIESGAEKEND